MSKKKISKSNQTKISLKIALYIRVSTEEQAENPEGSIKNQEERLRQTVSLKNMEGNFGEVVDVFIDRAKSGKDTNRPELQRMLNAIRRREITLVMVSELSRLSRSIKDFSEIWELIQECECSFLSLRENFDTTTAAGEMVLYSVANIAQFERRQISERVRANMNARAARGLYNGGPVPVGYELIPDKSGYLAINETQAEVIRTVFKSFLEYGSLGVTARFLNEKGVRLTRPVQGGGKGTRLGHFTVSNLLIILRNKSYIGVKTYEQNGEQKETKAVWEPIVDVARFTKAQEILDKNYSRYKPDHFKTYPYFLSGLIFCDSCKSSMCGKSAHGATTKVAYYEHGWLTKRNGCLVKKGFKCNPYRLQAKKIEPLVWEQIEKLLKDPKLQEKLILSAKSKFDSISESKELMNLESRIRNHDSQIEALAERLSQLPKNIPATVIFKQMEKLETMKAADFERLQKMKASGLGKMEHPTAFPEFSELMRVCKTASRNPNEQAKFRTKIIKSLISKIELLQDGFRLHYKVGKDTIKGELASAGSPALVGSSRTLTNGDPEWS